MAKILVADDNSNVQKTVALALAELGVDVISVNNGEAAVRKLADFSPDLVLADIFMPVRNGYEVCEFVKKQARFANVPVVLLVGAFDPLDEREAQRVGADGILKKPFVPPDPLITMVKSLLDRTLGDRMIAVSAGRQAAVAGKSKPAAAAEERSPSPPIPEQPEVEQFSHPASPVTFEEGNHPVAFGQLLEAPTQDASAPSTGTLEPVDNELVLTSPRDATLGDPIFWRNDDPEREALATVPEEPEDIAPSPNLRSWQQGEDHLPRPDEDAPLQPIELLELVRDEVSDAAPTIVDPNSIMLNPADQSPLTVESGVAPELAANPLEWMATALSPHSVDAATSLHADEAVSGTHDAIPAVAMRESERPPQPESVVVPVFVPAIEKDSSSPTELAASKGPEIAATAFAESSDHNGSAKSQETIKTHPSLPQLTPKKVDDTLRSIPEHDWSDLSADIEARAATKIHPAKFHEPLVPIPVEEVVSAPKQPETAAHSPAESAVPAAMTGQEPAAHVSDAAPDPALVEAVVQRVLDKMRPQVVDIITREFLRPIVQALVHREVEKH